MRSKKGRHGSVQRVHLIFLAGACLTGVVRAAEPISVGTTAQLFVDDFLVEKLEGLQRVVQQPRREHLPGRRL